MTTADRPTDRPSPHHPHPKSPQVTPEDIGPKRPKSPTPKPSMLPTGGFPSNAGTFPTLQPQQPPPGQQQPPHAADQPQTPPHPASPPPRSRFLGSTPPQSIPAGVNAEHALEVRERQQRDIVRSLQSPAASPGPPRSPPPASQPQQQQQQQPPLSHSVGIPGSGTLLGTKRRSLAFPEFCRRLERFLPPVGIPGPGFLYTHSCDPSKERDRHLTFHPRINPRSEEIVVGRWRARARTEVFGLLHAEGEAKVKRLEEARREKAAHILDECTFRPFLFSYRGGQPHYRYPGEKVWVQHVAATPRSRSAFAVARHGRFEAPRPRSTPPVRLKGAGAYNKEQTPTHDWPAPVVRFRGCYALLIGWSVVFHPRTLTHPQPPIRPNPKQTRTSAAATSGRTSTSTTTKTPGGNRPSGSTSTGPPPPAPAAAPPSAAGGGPGPSPPRGRRPWPAAGSSTRARPPPPASRRRRSDVLEFSVALGRGGGCGYRCRQG